MSENISVRRDSFNDSNMSGMLEDLKFLRGDNVGSVGGSPHREAMSPFSSSSPSKKMTTRLTKNKQSPSRFAFKGFRGGSFQRKTTATSSNKCSSKHFENHELDIPYYDNDLLDKDGRAPSPPKCDSSKSERSTTRDRGVKLMWTMTESELV